jgi:hypothetical protein
MALSQRRRAMHTGDARLFERAPKLPQQQSGVRHIPAQAAASVHRQLQREKQNASAV